MRRDRRHPLSPGQRRGLTALAAGLILVAALAVRVGYIEHTPFRAINDAGTYNRLASMVARDGDYHTGDAPGSGAGGSRGPTAYFPPAYPYFLGLVDILDGHQAGHKTALTGARIGGAVLGTIAVALLGLVAAEVFGTLAALLAMAMAAGYPVFIELSGTLVAENLLVPLELAAVWAALRAARAQRPWGWITACGLLLGLATLTHENAIVFLLPLAVAVAGAARGRVGRRVGAAPGRAGGRPDVARGRVGRRAGAVALLAIGTAVMIAPWTIRNADELHHFVPVSDESGITLVGTYNPASAAFEPVPYKWRYFIQIPQDAALVRHAGRYTEVALGDRLQSQAVHYIDAHPTAPLQVAWTNIKRMFELDGSYAWHAAAVAIGLRVAVARTGVVGFWVLCLLAIPGIFTRRAREGPKWLWALPLLYALSIVFVNVETPRFREPIDPFLILLAACAVSTVIERLRSSPPWAPTVSRHTA